MPVAVLGVLAVLVPVLWLVGGFKETPKQPAKRPGEPLDLGLFTVTVHDARIGLVDAGFGSARERFLIVRMRVLNNGKETTSLGIGGLGNGVVALTKAGKWVKPEQVEGVAAGAKTDTTQPGLPVEASAMWKMGPADAPTKLTVGLKKWEYEHGFTDVSYKWLITTEGDDLAGPPHAPGEPAVNAREILLRAGAGIGGTLLLAGAMWLHTLRPKVEAAELDPIRTGGTVGEEITTRSFSLRVDRVDVARSLAPSLSLGDPPPVGTDGVYLVVRLRAMSREEPIQLRAATLETPGGYTFKEDPRTGTASADAQPTFQPLIWTPTAFLFELPKERLEGAHLVVGTGGLLPQLSAAADVDLGLTGSRAAELIRGAAERYEIEEGP
ncbi:hypothetical protein [Actinomadura madurae]|uniref:hypothetical protein n=2 Tax=Actinomadura madurae TaxID=1993 RepID=UPI0020D20FA5|nr:hypothetical protein [Actinomadura madurae]MCP9980060.1 hypothetical protein [Actinomadura madurae]